ncbi:hypothetical protein KY5_6479 [Streptomyces formicae]|uniref:Uncharacterized protein n=1 Tax=Streptomyces formicae TaxID=1616117 RepID=A0A291QIY8_9ACTN|nr:hypothetical protein KY5_6479 [Streptomyces formicae]
MDGLKPPGRTAGSFQDRRKALLGVQERLDVLNLCINCGGELLQDAVERGEEEELVFQAA